MQSTVTATVVGVAQPGLGGAVVATANGALTGALADRQNVGVPRDQAERWASAAVRVAPGTDAAGVTAMQDRLTTQGFTGRTVADQLGSFTAVIDAIVLILNGFGVIALLAAGFGIVNTLFMAVQERTREIGLLKAMGMGRARVFSLFSLEAGFIGVLGSVLGAAAAVGVGTLASSVLAGGLLADLPGLTLIAFAPLPVVLVGLLVVGIALLAGTMPDLRAARQDPITSLRYERERQVRRALSATGCGIARPPERGRGSPEGDRNPSAGLAGHSGGPAREGTGLRWADVTRWPGRCGRGFRRPRRRTARRSRWPST